MHPGAISISACKAKALTPAIKASPSTGQSAARGRRRSSPGSPRSPARIHSRICQCVKLVPMLRVGTRKETTAPGECRLLLVARHVPQQLDDDLGGGGAAVGI